MGKIPQNKDSMNIDDDGEISGWRLSALPNGSKPTPSAKQVNSSPGTSYHKYWKTEVKYMAQTLVCGKAKNEDSVLQFQSSDGTITAVGVFDGHGLSAFACTASKLCVKIASAWFGNYNKAGNSTDQDKSMV